jgi:hypothetical protein
MVSAIHPIDMERSTFESFAFGMVGFYGSHVSPIPLGSWIRAMRSLPGIDGAHGLFHPTSTRAQESGSNTKVALKLFVDRITSGRCVLDPTTSIRETSARIELFVQVWNFQTAGATQAYSSGSVSQDSNHCIDASAKPVHHLEERLRRQGDNLDSVSVVACLIGSSAFDN